MKFEMAKEAVNPVVIVICDENEPKINNGIKALNKTDQNSLFKVLFIKKNIFFIVCKTMSLLRSKLTKIWFSDEY